MQTASFGPWRPDRRPLTPGLPRVIGHRGAKGTSPENTLASIREAHAMGMEWVEFDVKLSADGIAILMHDETLDRTTDGRGAVAQAPFAAIAGLDAGGWFDARFAGEPVPTLEAVLRLLASLRMGANVEIKPCPGREAETARVATQVIRRCWPADAAPLLLSSFKIASLEAAQAAAPELPRGLLVEELPKDWAETMQRLACTSLHPGHKQMDPATLRDLAAKAVPVLFYTVNETARAKELLDAGAAAVITDYPARILAGLG